MMGFEYRTDKQHAEYTAILEALKEASYGLTLLEVVDAVPGITINNAVARLEALKALRMVMRTAMGPGGPYRYKITAWGGRQWAYFHGPESIPF